MLKEAGARPPLMCRQEPWYKPQLRCRLPRVKLPSTCRSLHNLRRYVSSPCKSMLRQSMLWQRIQPMLCAKPCHAVLRDMFCEKPCRSMPSPCQSRHHTCNFMLPTCKSMLCQTMLAGCMCKSMHWQKCKPTHWPRHS